TIATGDNPEDCAKVPVELAAPRSVRRNISPVKSASENCEKNYERFRSAFQMVSSRSEIEPQVRPNTDAREIPSRHISTKPPASGAAISGYLVQAGTYSKPGN